MDSPNSKYISIVMEKELFDLLKSLFQLDNLHQEYNTNDYSYVIDSQKEGNTMTIKVTFSENKDKEEFESYVNEMPDDLFNEIWESLSEKYGLKELNELYEGNDYKQVISLFKEEGAEILKKRIEEASKLLEQIK